MKVTKNIRYSTQGDQNVSVHQTITVKSSGAQRHFDHPVYVCVCVCKIPFA